MLTAAVATDHLHTYVHVHMDVHTLTHNHSQAHTCTHTRTKTHMHTHRRCPSRIPCGFWMTCPTAKCFRSCQRWATRGWCKWLSSQALLWSMCCRFVCVIHMYNILWCVCLYEEIMQVPPVYPMAYVYASKMGCILITLVCTSFDINRAPVSHFFLRIDFPVSPSQRCTDWKSFPFSFRSLCLSISAGRGSHGEKGGKAAGILNKLDLSLALAILSLMSSQPYSHLGLILSQLEDVDAIRSKNRLHLFLFVWIPRLCRH